MRKNYFIIMLLLGLYSCQKEVFNSNSNTNTNPHPNVDVYVAGSVSSGSHSVATYWKNGSPVSLTDGSYNAEAYSIFVSGNDVYVCGEEYNGSFLVAKYWKNGSPVTLSDGSIDVYANSIAISGNDVYIAGRMGDVAGGHALYWKNGKAIYLPENADSAESTANSIFISGKDVYIAGGETKIKVISPYPDLVTEYTPLAVYWKNGNAVYLTDGSYGDEVYSIFVAGNDVYASGGVEAQYWKNGNPVYLPYDAGEVFANSIFVSGNDAYVAGTEITPSVFPHPAKQFGMYWKNGVPVNLSDHTDSTQCTASSIFVSGIDVYVAGSKGKWGGSGGDSKARYWKNESPVDLSDARSFANSIFITTK